MSGTCCHAPNADQHRNNAGCRKTLWIVLTINIAMFLTELIMGVASGSVSLQADALDFLGDAANYGISLTVASLALVHRARAALFKGMSMGLFGLWVLGSAFWHATHGIVPDARTMGLVGAAALVANAVSFILSWAYRSGDSNMQSVWLCSRNDAIGNCASRELAGVRV
jgi:Co/Zn/Cd efflux system component